MRTRTARRSPGADRLWGRAGLGRGRDTMGTAARTAQAHFAAASAAGGDLSVRFGSFACAADVVSLRIAPVWLARAEEHRPGRQEEVINGPLRETDKRIITDARGARVANPVFFAARGWRLYFAA